MLSRLANQIKSQHFPQGKALLAVSGGVDSMVLWAICRELKIPYAIAHFNFQLRAEESDQDQQFIESLSKKHQAEVFIRSESAGEFADQHNLSIQESAREMRYQWFSELIDEGKADYLMTAHHLDDSLETFLINLNRGTGLKGLSGIGNREAVFRPLLNYSKVELLEYAKEQGLEYREDSSNQKKDYLRNWFRHELIPIWKEKNPDLLQRMKANFERFQESNSILEHYLSKDLSKRLARKDSFQEFDLTDFDQLPFPEAVLRHWLSAYGYNADQVKQILLAVQQDVTGAIFYSRDFRLLLDRQKLILAEKENRRVEAFQLDLTGSYVIDNFQITLDEIAAEQLKLGEANVEYFDADKLAFPLTFRPWEAGDRMQPLGMKGQKKISDMLIDEKVDRFDKERQMVMLSNSEVAWLLGNRISEAFKVEASTKKVIRLRWSRH
jgi:tRNA(Ile)-lysidine synthase